MLGKTYITPYASGQEGTFYSLLILASQQYLSQCEYLRPNDICYHVPYRAHTHAPSLCIMQSSYRTYYLLLVLEEKESGHGGGSGVLIGMSVEWAWC